MQKLRCRFETKFAEVDDDAEIGKFTGYGAIFGELDSYGDVIAKGAFKDTLKKRAGGKLPKMLLQHGGWWVNDQDGVPIGQWTAMAEDEKGLRVEGRLTADDSERFKIVYGAMKIGELDGLSIGFTATDYSMGTKPEEPRRTLKKVDLMEVSVVTFPAAINARVTDIKAAHDNIRDFERFLRDEGGFSHAAAKAIASGGFKARSDPRDEDDGLTELRSLAHARGAAIVNLNSRRTHHA